MLLFLVEADRSAEANPEAVKFENEGLIHSICVNTKGDILKKLISLFLAVNKDIFKIIDIYSYHPIHDTATYNTLDGIRYLLKIYSGSASMASANGQNILHCAMGDDENYTAVLRERSAISVKNTLIVHQHDDDEFTPLHTTLHHSRLKGFSAICQADEQITRDKAIYPDTATYEHLFLPLHFLIDHEELTFTSPLSEVADCRGLLLKHYPEAAGFKSGTGRTPYNIAIGQNFNPYVQRLLLRADPTINPTELYSLNYEQRNMAMVLPFRAVVVGSERNIWSRLGIEKIDKLRHVVSFL